MSIPKAVFLDTSILDGQNYNYQSTALSTFVPACTKRGVSLLLPEPTDQEIERHIKERSADALVALAEARRKAPFLAKWPGMPPPTGKSETLERFQVYAIARKEWRAFLKQFTVVTLGYEDLDVKKVMRWYGNVEAPFRDRKKRKEFPDAFAVAMLEAYAQQEGVYVAVVSSDPDFKRACERFSSLLYFESIPRFTELLLSDDTRIDQLRDASVDIDDIESEILEMAPGLSLYHDSDRYDVRGVENWQIESIDTSIVAIGDHECTITFNARLEVEVELQWDEWASDEETETVVGNVDDTLEVPGTAKISFDVKTGKLAKVTLLEFDEDELEIKAVP
jgi:hypothetical protein